MVLFDWFTVIMMVAGIMMALRKRQVQWFVFFAVGITGIWGFIGHTVFAAKVAESIGWATSPFQFEVAVANLGMGVAGLLAPLFGIEFAVAVTVMVSCFSWGAAYGHVKQMIVAHDYAINNAGPIFWTDIVISAVAWIMMGMWHRRKR